MPYISLYLLASTVVYLCSRVYCFLEFKKATRNIWKDDKNYAYHWDIHIMSIAHSTLFTIIGLYVFSIIATGLVFTRKQYDQLITMSIIVSALYLIPVLFIFHKTFIDKDAQDGIILFFQWLFTRPFENGQGSVSLAASLAIHIQIFISLIWLSGVTSSLNENINKLNTIREGGRSLYNALEL